jgi:hypothetical protein
MSQRNGEKARFNIQRKKRLLRRKHTRELQQTLENKIAGMKSTQSQVKALETWENEGGQNPQISKVNDSK